MKTLARFLTQFPRWSRLPALIPGILLGLAVCLSSARAQSGAGSIQGTVTDSTGAVIPGALVHVVNDATLVATDTKTNSVGFYQAPELFTGHYTVTVTAPGMKTYKTSIELLVAQYAVVNVTMTAGAVTQTIQVSGNQVQLTTTDSGTIAYALENQRINQIPMNGRILMNLVQQTTPGIDGQAGERANGLLGVGLDIVADGVPLNNRQFGGGSSNVTEFVTPDPDAVQEVQVQTSNTSAQYSLPATEVITTKSGTNELHGSLFETARNNAIGAAKARQDATDLVAPHLVRNEFGANAGGPIVLPHVYHGKDKSFWFFAYERYSDASTTSELVSVPTPQMEMGNFSAVTNSANVPQYIMDPLTTTNSSSCQNPATPLVAPVVNKYCRTQYDYNGVLNQINPALKSTTAQKIYAITQQPSIPNANPFVTPNLSSPDIALQTIPSIAIRLDHVFNENNRAYLRYQSNDNVTVGLRNSPSKSPYTIAATVGGANFPFQASGMTRNPSLTFAPAIGYTHIFSPTFFSETVVSQQWYSQHNFAGGNPNLDYEQMLGTPNNFGSSGFPNYGASLITPYGGTQFIYGMAQIVDTADENLTKTVGKHQILFGGRYRHERFGVLEDEQADTIAFSGLQTALYNPTSAALYTQYTGTGSADADNYLGGASSFGVVKEAPYTHYRDMQVNAYIQDNYRLRRDLTINLGIRWEADPSPWTKYGLATTFDFKNDALVTAAPLSQLISEGYTTQAIITNLEDDGAKFETPQQFGYPGMNYTTLQRNYDLNFLPRVGVAYQLFGGKWGTVLRGAFGRYTYPEAIRTGLRLPQTQVPFTASYTQSYTTAAQAYDALPNEQIRYPLGGVDGTSILGTSSAATAVNTTSTTAIPPAIGLDVLPPNSPPDFVTQTNFTIEQPFKGNSALRVSYVYTHATNLQHEFEPNLHPTTFVWEMAQGIVPPTGTTINTPTYSTTAQGPYDQTTWSGALNYLAKDGWSNYNALEVNYQRLYHSGIAYQVYWTWSKNMRVGGNGTTDGTTDNYADFLGAQGPATGTSYTFVAGQNGALGPYNAVPAPPPGVPIWSNYHALERFEGYTQDAAGSTSANQHIEFNGIYDMPFGRGKRFLGNANRFVDELVGGWQIAGVGNIASQRFAPGLGYYGPTSPIHIYKHKHPIVDCRSGVCENSFMWFNGYLAPTTTLGVAGSACVATPTAGCVTGLPADYVPDQVPINNTPGTTDYGNEDVTVTLTNGKTSTTPFASGPQGSNPLNRTWLPGPYNWTIDGSIYKVISITERVKLRINGDAFNALNMQGWNNPATSGVETNLSSYNTPRQIQLTMRLSF